MNKAKKTYRIDRSHNMAVSMLYLMTEPNIKPATHIITNELEPARPVGKVFVSQQL